MKHLLKFTELNEDYSIYLESEDLQLLDDISESYDFEDFTLVDIEDVKELLSEGLTPEQIAIELDFEIEKVHQIIQSLKNAEDLTNETITESNESGVTASLKKKSKASGIPMGILRKVFATYHVSATSNYLKLGQEKSEYAPLMFFCLFCFPQNSKFLLLSFILFLQTYHLFV